MAPPQGQMRPGRQLAILGGLFVVLYLMVMFVGTGPDPKAGRPEAMGWAERFKPQLGLDLVGGMRMTLQAKVTPGDPPPSREKMEEARNIIALRVDSKGVSEASVVVEGDTNIVVSKAGASEDTLGEDIGEAAQMRFRKVLKATNGQAIPPQATPSASAASPQPAASAAPKPVLTGKPASPVPTANAAPAPTASPAPPAAGAVPTATTPPQPGKKVEKTPAQVLAEAKAVVGAPAWAAAEKLTAPAEPTNAALAPFEKLSVEQVAVLPPAIQFNVPQITCEKLDKRERGAIQNADERVVACEEGTKYLLDIATVVGDDIENASPQVDTTGQRVVSLDFDEEGTKKWTKLTGEAFRNDAVGDSKCAPEALGSGQHCRVAVVLDNTIVSSPEIQGVLGANSQITGQFSQADATNLANQIRYGALPLTFETVSNESVTPTLGEKHLKAGLLAAGIGMLLVILYSFFYYRLLGTVIFLSLILSAVLVFGALIVLGRQIGFTLTMAGIAGFIVSLGVAADSFVIYFERLKDEIQEGRSPRSAVPRAWARAKRTIISANAITIMAAVILYIVSVGTVQGFAFALGLATVLDLVVVFLFRHPIMTLFASTKAFLSPRVSGLGRVLLQRDETTKEA
ncbi:protein translocase subunit SecD [Pilimelia columellifera]|uniref:Protein translocase subunit SecD n=1 Tax=Pilimelia columellifera subsp. columellifera TaxID=706583 RepID=A0ABN3NMW9_9ACTN